MNAIVITESSEYDYTNHVISKEKALWFDHGHFNYQGAIKFTEEINKLINSTNEK